MHIPILFLLYTWGPLFGGVPSRLPSGTPGHAQKRVIGDNRILPGHKLAFPYLALNPLTLNPVTLNPLNPTEPSVRFIFHFSVPACGSSPCQWSQAWHNSLDGGEPALLHLQCWPQLKWSASVWQSGAFLHWPDAGSACVWQRNHGR